MADARAWSSDFSSSLSGLCSLKRFLRRRRDPFSNMDSAAGCRAQYAPLPGRWGPRGTCNQKFPRYRELFEDVSRIFSSNKKEPRSLLTNYYQEFSHDPAISNYIQRTWQHTSNYHLIPLLRNSFIKIKWLTSFK